MRRVPILKHKAPPPGNPISLASGNTYIRQTDIRQLPGLGFGIGLERAWNSLWPQTQTMFITGIFGVNWRSTYEERVFMGSDGYIKYARADGSFWSFGFDETGIKLAAPSTAAASLSSTSSLWTVTFQSGEKRTFDFNTGNLTAIVDRNGNTTQIQYDSYGRLSKVIDPKARYLIFTYGTATPRIW